MTPQTPIDMPGLGQPRAPRRAIERLRASPSRTVTLTLLATQAATAVGAVVVNLISARVMGPSGRGELALLLQLAYLGGSLAILGTDRPYIAAYQSTFSLAIGHQLSILRPVAWFVLLASAMAGVAALVLPSHASMLALAAVLMGIGNVAYRLVTTAYISSKRSSIFAWVTIWMQVILLAGAVIAYLATIRSASMWLVLYALSTLPSVVLVLRFGCRENPPKLGRSEIRSLRSFGFRLLPSSLGNTAMLRSDRILLPVLASTRELGIYVVVASIMELTAWPVKNYVDATLWQWRRRAEAGTLSVTRYVAGAAVITAAVSTVVALGSIVMIVVFLGRAYHASIPLVVPLGIASVFYAMSRVLQGALVAKSAGTYASTAELSGMLISVIAYVALIPMLGAEGAAIGSAIGYSGCCVVTSVLLRSIGRRTGRHRV